MRTFVLATLLLSLLAACAAPGAQREAPATDDSLRLDSLTHRYQAAVEDAQTLGRSAIYRGLTPIVPENQDLVWRHTASSAYVLVVNWTDQLPGELTPDSTLTATDEIWVTVAPELQRFCSDLALQGDRLHVRLAQLLGLPPDVEYNRVAELWVDPQDLFRPCPDPEISDHECERERPRSRRFIQVSEAHQDWMASQREAAYEGIGYPWTQLGYTYDWGQTGHFIGLSEFVIRPGAHVEVREIVTTDTYCR